MQIINISLGEIKSLRDEYLNSLIEFQELYLEMMLGESNSYILMEDDKQIGYCIINKNNELIEYYIVNQYIKNCIEYFLQIINGLSVKRVLCKSFDYLLLKCSMIFSESFKVLGTLFRGFNQTMNIDINEFQIRFADPSDIPFLLEQKDELYETPEELEYFVKNSNIIMFEKGTKLYGCGYLIKVHDDYNYYDIGMWTNPDFRNQGVATYIIGYLKSYCLRNGYYPICGCAFTNIASKKTLEKNGFYSKHNLFTFDFPIK